ncbi:hypothetical protein, partial [Propionibacterium freudenreichii]|uniref:hypothetical protein n=1 Tax=Propionibacterium freudenreichii TaxID=1744 RepID=UPI003851B2C2
FSAIHQRTPERDVFGRFTGGQGGVTHKQPATGGQRRELTEGVSNPGADLLAHIMAWKTDQHSSDRKLTIGDLVSRWSENDG